MDIGAFSSRQQLGTLCMPPLHEPWVPKYEGLYVLMSAQLEDACTNPEQVVHGEVLWVG